MRTEKIYEALQRVLAYFRTPFSLPRASCFTAWRNPLPNQSSVNRPRSIYQYSNMAPWPSGQTSIFGVVFFVSKSLLGIEGQRKLEKFAILTRKPRSHARILIYRTWPIACVTLDDGSAFSLPDI